VHTFDSPIFCKCDNLRTLGWNDDSKAKELLARAAEAVKPVMAKRKWRVHHLSEFYPPAPQLLGLNHNHGQKVEIRLRSPRNKNQFLPYESILGTLLHELCHNEIGPHNAEFYKLLDEVTQQMETLQPSNGFAPGDGFKLSTNRRNPDSVDRRRLAAAAAERRLQRSSLFKSGRLGGGEDGIHLVCCPREMAFNAAARRLLDDKWCGSTAVAEPEERGSREESAAGPSEPVITLDSDSEPSTDVIDLTSPVQTRKVARTPEGNRTRPTGSAQMRLSRPTRQTSVARAAMRRLGQS